MGTFPDSRDWGFKYRPSSRTPDLLVPGERLLLNVRLADLYAFETDRASNGPICMLLHDYHEILDRWCAVILKPSWHEFTK